MLRDVLGFLRFVARRWSEDRCPQVAGSLTYTTLLALVPMFGIAVALLSSAPFFDRLMAQIRLFLRMNLLPEIADRIIGVYMEEISRNAAELTTVGVAALFAMAMALMLTVDRSLNAIWRVRRARPFWICVPGYVVLLATGPVLIGVSVSVTTYLVTMSMAVSRVPESAETLLIRAAPVIVSSFTFFLVYRLIPNRRVPWRHAFVGGVAAGVLFEIAKELFAAYVRYVPTYSVVYGTFASIPVFLLWVYLSWLMVLFGAELTASLAYWPGGHWRRRTSLAVRFRDAIAVARRLAASDGAPMRFNRLRGEMPMPAYELEDTLIRMAEEEIVRRDGRAGYVLAKPPEAITLGDLYRVALSPAEAMRPEDWAALTPELLQVAGAMEADFQRPLAHFLDARGGA